MSVSPSFVALAIRNKAERAAESRMNRILDETYGPWRVPKLGHALSQPGKLVLITRLIHYTK